jgi:hypothetical protein
VTVMDGARRHDLPWMLAHASALPAPVVARLLRRALAERDDLVVEAMVSRAETPQHAALDVMRQAVLDSDLDHDVDPDAVMAVGAAVLANPNLSTTDRDGIVRQVHARCGANGDDGLHALRRAIAQEPHSPVVHRYLLDTVSDPPTDVGLLTAIATNREAGHEAQVAAMTQLETIRPMPNGTWQVLRHLVETSSDDMLAVMAARLQNVELLEMLTRFALSPEAFDQIATKTVLRPLRRTAEQPAPQSLPDRADRLMWRNAAPARATLALARRASPQQLSMLRSPSPGSRRCPRRRY